MSGDAHVRIRERLGVKLPRATRRLAHCRSKNEAEALKVALQARLAECGLEMHPTKSKIVYCKDSRRKGVYPNVTFDFLGYCFRPRRVRNPRRAKSFCGFTPAVSASALKSMRDTIRDLNIRRRTQVSMAEIAEQLNPILRGWIEYYGRYTRSALGPILRYVNMTLEVWLRRKFKRYRGHKTKAGIFLKRLSRESSGLFAHWKIGMYGSFA
jgi:RNA-directed DNA polymerase